MNTRQADQAVDRLHTLFSTYGHKTYGEQCSQTVHAVSCALHGESLLVSESLIIAALLHDVGHFVADCQQLPDVDQWGYAAHDTLGAAFLSALGFPAAVTEPVRLHVSAKRYLVSRESRSLSTASLATLQQQGGAMTVAQANRFEREHWFASALQLRHLDEQGKPDAFSGMDIDPWLDRVACYLAQSAVNCYR